jgi:hypothetical protein
VPEYGVDFYLPGVGELAEARLRDLSAAFGRAFDDASSDVRWVGTHIRPNTVRCVIAAPHETAVYDAALRAHLSPDAVSPLRKASDYEATPAGSGVEPPHPESASTLAHTVRWR